MKFNYTVNFITLLSIHKSMSPQFFLENSKLDEEELAEERPAFDLEEAANQVRAYLKSNQSHESRL